MVYLYDELNMIHRDLKPSNILLNSLGEVKLCDFGDSVELINSKAGSVVGTIGYMAPERVQGHHYTITSDVWSLGVTMMELATGLFPLAHVGECLGRQVGRVEDNGMGSIAIVELLEGIVNDPLPELDRRDFSNDLCDFVSACMLRDHHHRPTPMSLLVQSCGHLFPLTNAIRLIRLFKGIATSPLLIGWPLCRYIFGYFTIVIILP